MKKEETKFREKIQKFLKKLEPRTANFSIQQVAIRGDADKIICCNGWFVWMEIKTDEGEHEPLQKWKASLVKAAGGKALVVRPKNWELVKGFLNQLNGGIYDPVALRRIEQDELSAGPAQDGKRAAKRPKSF